MRPSCSGGELRVLYDALANGPEREQILTYIHIFINIQYNTAYILHTYLAYITDPKRPGPPTPAQRTWVGATLGGPYEDPFVCTGIWHVYMCLCVQVRTFLGTLPPAEEVSMFNWFKQTLVRSAFFACSGRM